MGLFGPLATSSLGHVLSSVERGKRRFDAHGTAQDTRERAMPGRALETREPPAGVDAAAGLSGARRQRSVLRDETDQLRLRGFPAAAGAGPNWLVRHPGLVQPAHPGR